MGLKVSDKAKNIPTLESGVYTGICVGVVDLGEQKNERFNKYQNRVLFFFEIAGEFVDVGEGELKPRWLSKEFTASLNSKSNLSKTLQSWRNKPFTPEEAAGFDLGLMLGEACQLQVMEEEKNDRKYNNIQNIIGLPKGMRVEPPMSELIMFDMDYLEEAEEVLPKLPEWVQDRINKSTTWARLHQNTEELDVEECETDELSEDGMETPF